MTNEQHDALVEAVARAISTANPGWVSFDKSDREEKVAWLKMAQAALAAICQDHVILEKGYLSNPVHVLNEEPNGRGGGGDA
jgi:hypothetical protein